MLLHDTAAEASFDATIDPAFPYDDDAKATSLIAEARAISLNAVFCVLEEICRRPQSAAVTRERQLELLARWSSGFEHDLKAPLARCARSLIQEEPLPWSEAVSIMEAIGQFDGQRAALSIAYFS